MNLWFATYGSLLKVWLREQDLNLWPSGYEPDELPTAPSRDNNMVDRAGFEPAKAEPADLQSAPFSHSGTYPNKMELETGLEPATSSLQVRCSTS